MNNSQEPQSLQLPIQLLQNKSLSQQNSILSDLNQELMLKIQQLQRLNSNLVKENNDLVDNYIIILRLVEQEQKRIQGFNTPASQSSNLGLPNCPDLPIPQALPPTQPQQTQLLQKYPQSQPPVEKPNNPLRFFSNPHNKQNQQYQNKVLNTLPSNFNNNDNNKGNSFS